MLQDFITPLVAVSIILAILMPIWGLLVAMRIARHLYHISTALWQIRDALRGQHHVVPAPEERNLLDPATWRHGT